MLKPFWFSKCAEIKKNNAFIVLSWVECVNGQCAIWKKSLILILGHYAAFEFLEKICCVWQLNATVQCTFANMQNGVYVLRTIEWNGILKVNKKNWKSYVSHNYWNIFFSNGQGHLGIFPFRLLWIIHFYKKVCTVRKTILTFLHH